LVAEPCMCGNKRFGAKKIQRLLHKTIQGGIGHGQLIPQSAQFCGRTNGFVEIVINLC
jgi:hypothetical protein